MEISCNSCNADMDVKTKLKEDNLTEYCGLCGVITDKNAEMLKRKQKTKYFCSLKCKEKFIKYS